MQQLKDLHKQLLDYRETEKEKHEGPSGLNFAINSVQEMIAQEELPAAIICVDQPSDIYEIISELKNYGISTSGLMPPIRFVEFNSFEDIFDQCWKWQDAVFDTTAEQACNGIRKEAKELQHAIEWQTPAQIHIEVADVLMYVIYVAKKYGMNWDDVKHALKTKLEINKLRNWKKLDDGTHRHI